MFFICAGLVIYFFNLIAGSKKTSRSQSRTRTQTIRSKKYGKKRSYKHHSHGPKEALEKIGFMK